MQKGRNGLNGVIRHQRLYEVSMTARSMLHNCKWCIKATPHCWVNDGFSAPSQSCKRKRNSTSECASSLQQVLWAEACRLQY